MTIQCKKMSINNVSSTNSNTTKLKHSCSQRQKTNRKIFSTNTLPYKLKRDNFNNNSIRHQADIIRYIPSQNTILSDLPDVQYMQRGPYVPNIFAPDVHSTPVLNGDNSKKFSFKNSIRNAYLPQDVQNPVNDYETYTMQNLSNVPTISKKIEMDSNVTLYPNVCTEGKVIKRRGIRGVSWIFNLALKDDSVGKIYRKQIGLTFCIIIMLLVFGVVLGCITKYISVDFVTRYNYTKVSPKYESIDYKLYKNLSEDNLTTTTEQDISTTVYHKVNARLTTFSSTVFSVKNQTDSEKRNEYKTDIVNTSKNQSDKDIHMEYTHDELENTCRGCRRGLDVCITIAESGVPMCKVAVDIRDPTGCGGLCALDVEVCHLLNKKHSIYTCLALERYQQCGPNEWKCQNQFCILKSKKCDGEINCYDRSDELECDSCDLTKNFQCGNETSCLDMSKKCNGVPDCWDGSDEINCTAVCINDQFTCNDGECISNELFCDGLADCRDKSDEPMGCIGKCQKHEFECSNSRCVPKSKLCDGRDDCGDGSDERKCSRVKTKT